MKIAVCVPGEEGILGELIAGALRRSFTHTQVVRLSGSALAAYHQGERGALIALANPNDDWADAIAPLVADGSCKLAVFGRVGPRLAQLLGIAASPPPADWAESASCASAAVHCSTASILWLSYENQGLAAVSPIRSRPALRFDFSNEWNNLGFGAIRVDGSYWGLSHRAAVTAAATLASLNISDEPVSAYATLRDCPRASLLWFNRSVGPSDSAEWRLVEDFFANYRAGTLPCVPIPLEIPYGWDAAVTMRLDCDEDVESARVLFERYRIWNVPLSLAVKTSLLDDTRQHRLLHDVANEGGSLLSHSHTHPTNWGGSADAACSEAGSSARRIFEVCGRTVRYAVSPFHQNPPYAVQGLVAAGYNGFVGGIVANDPEYLLARGGEVLGGTPGFVSHSQQCMLHGDCMVEGDDPLAIYKESFLQALCARSIFGYLDHPFSQRYQYGWPDETVRIHRHEQLIEFMRASGSILFASEEDALDFVSARAALQFTWDNESWRASAPVLASLGSFAIEYMGRVTRLENLT